MLKFLYLLGSKVRKMKKLEYTCMISVPFSQCLCGHDVAREKWGGVVAGTKSVAIHRVFGEFERKFIRNQYKV